MNKIIIDSRIAETGFRIKEKQEKFNYYFVGITLATLALSVQFSVQYGKDRIFFLVLAWLFFVISFFLGTKYMIESINFDKANFDYLSLSEKNVLSPDQEEKLIEILEKKSNLQGSFFKLQYWFFVLGLILNGIFIIINVTFSK